MRTVGTCISLILLIGACGGGSGRPTGPTLPPRDTIRTVTGRIAFFTTGASTATRDANKRLVPSTGFVFPTFPRNAPNIPVEVRKPDGTVMGTAVTDDSGEYSITINFGSGAAATQLIVKIEAVLTMPFGTVVRVYPDEFATDPYTHETPPSGDPADEIMEIDLTVGLLEGAGAYYALDTLWEGLLAAKSGILADMPDIDILYKDGNGAVSTVTAGASRATIRLAGGIAGDNTSNTDVWDPPVVMRLLGEYLLAYFFHDVAPAGTPNDALLVPSAAWREGFLDFWACMGRNDPVFYDSVGSGTQGRIARYFHIDSFFDPALGSLGPDDPNVYQDPGMVGLGSRFTVAELLWDLHDERQNPFNGLDTDTIEFPLFLTLRFLEQLNPSTSYPYLYSLFDLLTSDNSLDPVLIQVLLNQPEDQGLSYPGTVQNGLVWPPQFLNPGDDPGSAISVGFSAAMSDTIDNVTPVPLNVTIGETSQRYFMFTQAGVSDVLVTLTTTGNLRVELMERDNTVLATGIGGLVGQNIPEGTYVIRVRSENDAPVNVPFDLRLTLATP